MEDLPQIVRLSGGKDSTAMLLMMLERGEKVAEAVSFDTGWEFPEMYDHLMDAKSWNTFRIDYSAEQIGARFAIDDMRMSIEDVRD